MRRVIRSLPSGTDLTHVEPNRYLVCVHHERDARCLRTFGHLRADGNLLSAEFSSTLNLQYPNPKLHALQAACARVARMSSAVEAFNELEHDVENTRALAFDGTSARLLDHLMAPFAAIPGVG